MICQGQSALLCLTSRDVATQLRPKDLPPGVENDVRSRLLANHRMPAYRHRALTRIRALTGLGPGGELSRTAHLTEELLPRSLVYSATAKFYPMQPPPAANATAQNRSATNLPCILVYK